MTIFANGLGVECEKKVTVKDDYELYGMGNDKTRTEIY